MSTHMRIACILILMISVFCSSLIAQSGTSRVTGTILDKTGAVIPGANVTLTNEGTKTSWTTTTSSSGTYVFDSVQIGKYTISAEMKGFKKFVSTGNALSIGQPMTVNASLAIGAVGEVMQVEGSAELVQTSTSGNFGNLVDSASIKTLPIVGSRGRNPLNFVNYQPGVVTTDAAGGDVHVHGSRDRAWNFTLDGVDINETSAGGSNFAPLRTNPDSVSEFRVITGNPTAEFGRNTGGQVTMSTTSGTNKFHGSGFWFYQTPGLNANEVSNKINSLPRSQFVQNIYGGSLGGPIWKNKTFFFTNIQLLHTRVSNIVHSTVYTQQARQGIFRYNTSGQNKPAGVAGASVDATGNVLPGVTIATYNIAANPTGVGLDPTIQSILNQTPLPNDFITVPSGVPVDGLNIAEYTWLAPEFEKQVDEVVKIDHIFNTSHSIFGRWSSGHQNTENDHVNGGLPPFPGAPSQEFTLRQPRNLALNWRWNISPTKTNEFIVGENRFIFGFFNPIGNLAQVTPISFPSNSGSLTMPISNQEGNARVLTTIQVADNYTFVKEAHTFKTGFNARYGRHIDVRGSIGSINAFPLVDFSTSVNNVGAAFGTPGTQVFNPTTGALVTAGVNGTFDLPNLRNAVNNLLGRVGNIQQGFVAQSGADQYAPGGTLLHFDFRVPEYDLYFQDSWKLKSNIVVDLGVRWEIRQRPSNTANQILHPDQAFVVGSSPSSTLKWVPGPLFGNNYKNIGPSIGIAWDPWKDGKTSVRANYRIGYDRINTFSLSSGIFQSLPGFTTQVTNSAFGTAGGLLRSGLPTIAPSAVPSALRQQPGPGVAGFSSSTSITVADPNLQTPRTHMFGFGIEREVAKSTVVSVNYVGRIGQNLYGGYDANQVDIIGNGFLTAFNTVKAGGTSALIDQLLAPDSRRPAALTGSQWLATTTGANASPFTSQYNLNSVAAIAASISARVQGGTTLPVLAGLPATFFQRYPQFEGGLNVLDSGDRSTYHALEVQASHRYSNGLTYQLSYTWAKSLDTRSFDPTFTRVARGNSQSASATPFDINNRELNYARSDFDRRHAVQGSYVYDLPFGKGKKWGHDLPGGLERIIGGWETSGIINLSSGRPFTIYSGSNTYTNVIQSTADCAGDCGAGIGSIGIDPTTGNPFLLNAAQRAQFTTPVAGSNGNTGRNRFDLPHLFQMDMAFGKKTQVVEGQFLELRLEMQNAFNNVAYTLAESSTITSSSFARERGTQFNTARHMQLTLKYIF